MVVHEQNTIPEWYAPQGWIFIPPAFYQAAKQKSVVIIGCGQGGSQVADSMFRVADWNVMYFIDFDNVEPRNLITQGYFAEDLGKPKALVLAERYSKIHQRTKIIPILEKWNGQYGDFMFICPDNMAARREVANGPLFDSEFIVDLRSGGPEGNIYCITAQNREFVREYYERTLYSDSNVTRATCAEQSFNGLAKLLVGRTMLHLSDYALGRPVVGHIECACESGEPGKFYVPEEFKNYMIGKGRLPDLRPLQPEEVCIS